MKSSACIIAPCCPDSKLRTPVSEKELQTEHETLGLVFTIFRTYDYPVACFVSLLGKQRVCLFFLNAIKFDAPSDAESFSSAGCLRIVT